MCMGKKRGIDAPSNPLVAQQGTFGETENSLKPCCRLASAEMLICRGNAGTTFALLRRREMRIDSFLRPEDN